MKRIIFRADGNEIIGSGHIMRCLSIAFAVRYIGAKALFILADKKYSQYIENQGFEYIVLNTDYSKLEEELETLKSFINPEDTLVVDSYFVTSRYLSALNNYCKLVYLDDIGKMPYPVDILINYNIYGEDIDYNSIYKNKILPKLVIGTKYTPLRDEFLCLQQKEIRDKVKNVLVSTGGADKEHVAVRLAKYIATHSEKFNDIMFNFIIGKYSLDLEKLKKIEKESDRIKLHINVIRMSEIMQESDAAISAAGSTLYELCACGVPAITYIFADNQILGAKAFERKKIMLLAGDIRKERNFENNIFNSLNGMVEDRELREQLSKRMSEAVNVTGAKKIAEILLTQ